jgi:hypothetical protein
MIVDRSGNVLILMELSIAEVLVILCPVVFIFFMSSNNPTPNILNDTT